MLIATLPAATFAIMALELAAPMVILQVYDRVVPNMSYDTLYVLVALAACPMIADFALRCAHGAMIALVLLSGRILTPLQRALSMPARRKDVAVEREKARILLSIPPIHATRDAAGALRPANRRRISLRTLSRICSRARPTIAAR